MKPVPLAAALLLALNLSACSLFQGKHTAAAKPATVTPWYPLVTCAQRPSSELLREQRTPDAAR